MGSSSYKIYNNNFPYFVTSSVVGWIELFIFPEITKILIDSLNLLVENKRIIIYGYVIMKDHLHLIVKADDLSKEISNFKSFTARQSIEYFKKNRNYLILQKLRNLKLKSKNDREYQFWQEGFHPKQINSIEILYQKLDYIHNNPIRKSFVENIYDWKLSSACDYNGNKGLIKVFTDWYSKL